MIVNIKKAFYKFNRQSTQTTIKTAKKPTKTKIPTLGLKLARKQLKSLCGAQRAVRTVSQNK